MLRAAKKEQFTRHSKILLTNKSGYHKPIYCDGVVAGFYTPHESPPGWNRIGPVYIDPAFRGRGLVVALYATLHGPHLAFIEHGNVASERVHERAGFKRTRKHARGWYWNRD